MFNKKEIMKFEQQGKKHAVQIDLINMFFANYIMKNKITNDTMEQNCA